MSVCKMFLSPSGCGFGVDCMDLHQTSAQNEQSYSHTQSQGHSLQKSKKAPICKAFASQNGYCQFGSSCNFRHEVRNHPIRKPVQKPVPKTLNDKFFEAADPAERIKILRAFELNQLSLRYPPVVTTSLTNGDTITAFKMKPTDPDFPFELENLEIKLQLPLKYPSVRNIQLSIMNTDIPKKLSNVIRKKVTKKVLNSTVTLLELSAWLDRNLESFLIEREEEPEVKITFVNPDEIKPPKESTVEARKEYYGELNLDYDNDTIEEKGSQNLFRQNVNGTDLDLIDSMNNIKVENQDSESEIGYSASESEQDVLLQDTDVKKTGTQVNLPNINLKNVSILRCIQLSMIVKCNRCKMDCQFINMRTGSSYAEIDCKQCSTVLRCRYRADLIHENSTCLGYLDLDQCVPWDLLPSRFLSTCSNCGKEQMEIQSTLIQIGQVDSPNCRSCHLQIRIELEKIRFYQLTQETEMLPLKKAKVKRIKDDSLKTVGLPNNGSYSLVAQRYIHVISVMMKRRGMIMNQNGPIELFAAFVPKNRIIPKKVVNVQILENPLEEVFGMED